MFTELLWIIGFYALAAVLTHAYHVRRAGAGKIRYVLLAGNHQMQMEWYLRSLLRYSRWTGKELGILVVLHRSTDETGRIVERFARKHDHIRLVRADDGAVLGPGAGLSVAGETPETAVRQAAMRESGSAAGEPLVWVDLNNREHLSRLPL